MISYLKEIGYDNQGPWDSDLVVIHKTGETIKRLREEVEGK
jgi:hypothetical protein